MYRLSYLSDFFFLFIVAECVTKWSNYSWPLRSSLRCLTIIYHTQFFHKLIVTIHKSYLLWCHLKPVVVLVCLTQCWPYSVSGWITIYTVYCVSIYNVDVMCSLFAVKFYLKPSEAGSLNWLLGILFGMDISDRFMPMNAESVSNESKIITLELKWLSDY